MTGGGLISAGVIVTDSETRTELSEKEIAEVNDALHQ